MLRNLNVFAKCLMGCGLTLVMFAPYSSAHAKGHESVHHSICFKGHCKKPIAAASKETILYAFKGGTDGANPAASLIADSSGNLYGTAGSGGDSKCQLTAHHVFYRRMKENPGCGVVFKLSATGHETTLFTFSGKNGAGPPGALYQDAKGDLFGVTAAGGDEKACGKGCGTVFEIASGGSEKLLYAFTGGNTRSNDGGAPDGTLVADASGDFYGTTAAGGSDANCGTKGPIGCGTVFELTPGGSEIILHTFSDPSSDGAYPAGSLVLDRSGNIYGLTSTGGSDADCGLGSEGCGVLFEISAAGAESILHQFTGGNDGAYPTGNLAIDGTGNIYFTTAGGGSNTDCGFGPYGCGALFKINSGRPTVLHSFVGGSDGAYPIGSLLVDTNGSVFGTTVGGGGKNNCGVGGTYGCGSVFEVSSGGKETVLHAFKGGKADGAYPTSGLISLNKHLYGMTAAGGTGCGKAGCGTVFEVKE